jgi:hypothetical protein
LHALVTFRLHKSLLNDFFNWEEYFVIGQFAAATASAIGTPRGSHSVAAVIPFRNYLRDKKSLQNLLGRYYEGAECSSNHPVSCCLPSSSHSPYSFSASTNKNWVPAPGDENYLECTQCFEFNRELLGWHYGWTSNKHRADDQHIFAISVYHRRPVPSPSASSSTASGSQSGNHPLLSSESHSLYLIGQGASPPFVVKSARRKTRAKKGGPKDLIRGTGATPPRSAAAAAAAAAPSRKAPPKRVPRSAAAPLVSDENSLREASDDLNGLEHRFQQLNSVAQPPSPSSSAMTRAACSFPRRSLTPPPSAAALSPSDISPPPRQSSSKQRFHSGAVRKKSRSSRSRSLEILPVASRSELEAAVGQSERYLKIKEEKRLQRLATLESIRQRELELEQETGNSSSSSSRGSVASVRSASTSSVSTDGDQVNPLPSSAALLSRHTCRGPPLRTAPTAAVRYSGPSHCPLRHPSPSHSRRPRGGGSGEWSTAALSALSLYLPPSAQLSLSQSERPPDFDAVFGRGGLEAEPKSETWSSLFRIPAAAPHP